MQERIKFIRKHNKLTQTEFGERIGVKGNTITGYENGLRVPSSAVITSICKEFLVNEDWLRTGEGEPFIQLTRDAQITKFVGEAMRGEAPSDQQRFLNAMLGATPDELQAIARFAKRLAAEYAEELAKEKKGSQ